MIINPPEREAGLITIKSSRNETQVCHLVSSFSTPENVVGVERNVGEKSTRQKFAELFFCFTVFLFVLAFWTMVQVSFRSGLPPGPWARILPGSTEGRKRFRIEFSRRFFVAVKIPKPKQKGFSEFQFRRTI